MVLRSCSWFLKTTLTVLTSSSILSYRNFWLSMIHLRFSLIWEASSMVTLLCTSEGGDGGEGAAGDKDFTAFKTSMLMRVSREDCPADPDEEGTGGSLAAFGIASGAALSTAALLRCSSRSLHLFVRISTVSFRSFFSEANFVASRRQASRSTLRFSFSNSSGERARVGFAFLNCLFFRGNGGAT